MAPYAAQRTLGPRVPASAEAEQNLEIDEKNRARWRTELYKAKSHHSSYKEELKEKDLLKRWPMFLDLQTKRKGHGAQQALREMQSMRPGKDATEEEVGEVSREMSFRTPCWQGKTAGTDIPERVLSPAEVYVINCKYLELNAAFQRRVAIDEATDEAEQNLEIER